MPWSYPFKSCISTYPLEDRVYIAEFLHRGLERAFSASRHPKNLKLHMELHFFTG